LPNGMLAGFVGNEVMFSEPGAPYAWPVAYRYTVDSPITALGVTANGLIVGTQSTPYLCQGSDPASMVPVRIEERQACISAFSMVDMGDYVIYASPDGLVGVSGMDVKVLTEGILTRDQWQATYSPSTLRGYHYEGRYLGIYPGGAFLFDPQDPYLVHIAVSATAGYNDSLSDTLYLQIGGDLCQWDAGAALTYTWKSRRQLIDVAINPAAARVDAAAYPVTFNLYGDGVLRHSQTVADGRGFRLPAGYRAFAFEVEISGTADVRQAVIATSMAELAG
jgi:hypothetical protein